MLLAPSAAMASELAAAPLPPPRSYRLETVELRVQRQPGHGQPRQALLVVGGGSATLEFGRPAVPHAFPMPATDILALINGLYRLRFFELPVVLGARPSVYLKPDGSLGTQVTRPLDTTSNTVCFSVPGYERCVGYTEGDGPQELEAWVRAAFADAQRRALPAAPEK